MKKTQSIKERLNAHRTLLVRLDALETELEYIVDKYDNPKTTNFSGMPRGGGARELNETESIVYKKMELEKKIENLRDEIDRDWDALEPLLDVLDPTQALIMKLRYQYGADWAEISRRLYGRRPDYDERVDKYQNKMFKTHGRALLTLSDAAIP